VINAVGTHYDLEGFPGAIHFYFFDAKGVKQHCVEKLPVIGLDYPENIQKVPIYFKLGCEIIRKINEEVYLIRLAHGTSNHNLETDFYIKRTD
jgi:hypothetical protein